MNHCAHGSRVVIEHVLEYRPYDRQAIRAFLKPLGSFASTWDIEPRPDAVRLHVRYGEPTGIARIGLLRPAIARFFAADLKKSLGRLETELRASGQPDWAS